MIHSVRFIAVLDTNVIYPIITRDILFWFAHYELYTPKWSQNIFNEWETVMIRNGVDPTEARRRIQIAQKPFPTHSYTTTKASFHGFSCPMKMTVTYSPAPSRPMPI